MASAREMAAVAEVPLPYQAVGEGDNTPEPDDAVVFVGVSLVLGIASRHLLRGTRVPYTVALLILGVGLGSLGLYLCFAISFSGVSLFLLRLALTGASEVPLIACCLGCLDFSVNQGFFEFLLNRLSNMTIISR